MSTQTIIVERRGRVGIVRLNRPQALNALNVTLKNELLGAVEAFDADAAAPIDVFLPGVPALVGLFPRPGAACKFPTTFQLQILTTPQL